MAAHNARTPDWKEQRRRRALGLKRDGWTHQEVAEALDVTKGAISRWMTRAAREGEEALRARPHLGAAPRLSPEQLRMLPEFLVHGAEASSGASYGRARASPKSSGASSGSRTTKTTSRGS